MMIAKPAVPAKSIPELMRRNRATLKQFAVANPGEALFLGFVQHRLLLLIDIISLLGCFAAIIAMVVASVMREWQWAGGSLATAVGLGIIAKIRWMQEARAHTAHNKEARCCLGALVQANSDLFNELNKEARWGFMVVDPENKLEEEPERLMHLAQSLFAMKALEIETPPELEELVAEIRDEVVRNPKRRPIPAKLIGVEGVLALDVFFKPKALPKGYLHQELWPVMYSAATDKVPFQPLTADLWWSEVHDQLLGEVELSL